MTVLTMLLEAVIIAVIGVIVIVPIILVYFYIHGIIIKKKAIKKFERGDFKINGVPEKSYKENFNETRNKDREFDDRREQEIKQYIERRILESGDIGRTNSINESNNFQSNSDKTIAVNNRPTTINDRAIKIHRPINL